MTKTVESSTIRRMLGMIVTTSILASAAIAQGRLLVTLPGSTAAVELALRRVLLPELAHAVRSLGRFPAGE